MKRTTAALLLAALLAPLLPGQQLPTGPRVQVEASTPWFDPAGYTPVQVTVDTGRAGTIAVRVACGAAEARDEWPVPAGVSHHVVLLPPLVGERWPGDPQVHWRLHEQSGRAHANSRTSDDLGCLYVAVDYDHFNDLQSTVRRANNGRRDESSHLQPEQLPDRWQAYPIWLTVVLTAGALERLTPAQVDALATWAQSGGSLASWDQEVLRYFRRLGAPATGLRDAEDQASLQRELNHHSRTHDPIATPVRGTEEVPVGGFIILVLLFAALVGPANLWWAVRSGRRWQLHIATPALSLGACILLIGYNLFAEGLDTRRMLAQLVVLDQERHQAIAYTGATYFAPLGVGGFELDAAAKVLPMNPEDQEDERHSRYSRSDSPAAVPGLGIDWRGGQRTDGTWVPSRINRRLVVVQPQAFRGRLILQREGERLQLLNGLDQPIEELVWHDAAGRRWGCAVVGPGETATLTEDPPQLQQLPNDLGAGARQAQRQANQSGWARVALAGPLLPVPGPTAVDVERRCHLLVALEPEEVRP